MRDMLIPDLLLRQRGTRRHFEGKPYHALGAWRSYSAAVQGMSRSGEFGHATLVTREPPDTVVTLLHANENTGGMLADLEYQPGTQAQLPWIGWIEGPQLVYVGTEPDAHARAVTAIRELTGGEHSFDSPERRRSGTPRFVKRYHVEPAPLGALGTPGFIAGLQVWETQRDLLWIVRLLILFCEEPSLEPPLTTKR